MDKVIDWIKSHPLQTAAIGAGGLAAFIFLHTKSNGTVAGGTIPPVTVSYTYPTGTSGSGNTSPSGATTGTSTPSAPSAPSSSPTGNQTPTLSAATETSGTGMPSDTAVIVSDPNLATGAPLTQSDINQTIAASGTGGVDISPYNNEPVGYSQTQNAQQNSLAEAYYADPTNANLAAYNASIGA